MDFSVRPIRRFVILVDDQPSDYTDENGVLVDTSIWSDRLDFYVAAVGTDEHTDIEPGDRVILSDPNAGRKVRLDGVVYRVVRLESIIAKVE